MNTERRTTKTGTTWMDHELGILRFEYAPGSVCKLPDAKENIKHQLEVSGGKTVPILVDVTKAKEVDGESRAYYASIKTFSAMALVIASPIGRVIGNIFFAVYGTRGLPTKLFTSEADAIQWLKTFIK